MEVGELRDGGRLQMLKVKGVDNAHLEAHQEQGATYDVEWVDIAQPDVEYDHTPGEPAPTEQATALTHVASQGWAQGAAYFSRLEGQVYDRGVVYFTSTQGGGEAMPGTEGPSGYGNGSGQVWAYDTRRQQLRCVFQSPGPMVLDLPDNVTTSKRGTLVVCEDSSGDQLPARADPARQDLGHRAQPAAQQQRGRAVRRRVRRLDVQPRRPHALRQHPVEQGHDVRDLGPLGPDRGLGRAQDGEPPSTLGATALGCTA